MTEATMTTEEILAGFSKLGTTQQAKLRALTAIAAVMKSNESDETKAEISLLALSQLRCETVVSTMAQLMKGVMEGHDLGLGIAIFAEAAIKRAKKDQAELVGKLTALGLIDEAGHAEKAQS